MAGGGQRKYDRNRKFCELYKKENRRIKNKRAKIRKHLKRCPDDKQATKVLESL